MFTISNNVRDALIGLVVGDALGVPVEFVDRDTLQAAPVTDMRGYGTHHQPPGTWSDDGSLTLCLAESLCQGYQLGDIAEKMVLWAMHDHWTARGSLFDIGITTQKSIRRLAHRLETHQAISPIPEADATEMDNGNGSLMRILPLAFYLKTKPVDERWRVISEVSGLTHGHIRASVACFIYLSVAIHLLEKRDLAQCYAKMQQEMHAFFDSSPHVRTAELRHFDRILRGNIGSCPMSEIQSSGYVVHTLEASLWSLANSENYAGAVLKAVNLGKDSDTTGAVTGGLAGLLYGLEDIPVLWVAKLARKQEILQLADALNQAMASGNQKNDPVSNRDGQLLGD